MFAESNNSMSFQSYYLLDEIDCCRSQRVQKAKINTRNAKCEKMSKLELNSKNLVRMTNFLSLASNVENTSFFRAYDCCKQTFQKSHDNESFKL